MVKKTEFNTIKFGEHMIFDAYGCEFEVLNSKEATIQILEKLVELAEMTKITDPVVVEATENETLGGKDPGGYSAFVMIQESHISLHTFAKRGFVTIDLYSCKTFPSKEVIQFLLDIYQPDDYDILKMERGLKYPTDNIYQ